MELEGRSNAPRLFSDAYAVLDFHGCRVVVTAQYKECLFSSFRDARLVELENQLIAAQQTSRNYRRIFPLLRGERVPLETRGRWHGRSHVARATGGICSIWSPCGGVDAALLRAGLHDLLPPELSVERGRRGGHQGEGQVLLQQRRESVRGGAVRGAPDRADGGVM